MFYSFIKSLFRLALKEFLSEIHLKGSSPKEDGPLLIVANHPNMALDSLIIMSVLKRQLWFLAKATLFKSKLRGFLLKSAHVVPIYRKQDNPEEMIKNRETFKLSSEILRQNKALLIFPEGVSRGERKLSPFKTGAVRIAFQAEEDQAFSLGVYIQPVGLTYTDLSKFKSSVTVNFGEPVSLVDWREEYGKNSSQAVHALTEKLEARLNDLTVEVKQVELVSLVEKLGKIYQSKVGKGDHHERLRIIAEQVERLAPIFPQKRKEIEERLDLYLELTSLFHLEESQPLDITLSSPFWLLMFAFVIVGIPFQWVPYNLVARVTKRFSSSVDSASWKFGLGLCAFPLWYLLVSIVFTSLITGPSWWFLAIFMLLTLNGHCVNKYLPLVRIYLLSRLWPGKLKPLEVVKKFRDELITELDTLKGIT